MTTSFAPLDIRRTLRRNFTDVSRPAEFGPDGWSFNVQSYTGRHRTIIVSCAEHDGTEWTHASIAATGELPTYGDLKALHAAVFGDGFAYQIFVPAALHVNIHENAFHLWGRADGKPADGIPEFGAGGSI